MSNDLATRRELISLPVKVFGLMHHDEKNSKLTTTQVRGLEKWKKGDIRGARKFGVKESHSGIPFFIDVNNRIHRFYIKRRYDSSSRQKIESYNAKAPSRKSKRVSSGGTKTTSKAGGGCLELLAFTSMEGRHRLVTSLLQGNYQLDDAEVSMYLNDFAQYASKAKLMTTSSHLPQLVQDLQRGAKSTVTHGVFSERPLQTEGRKGVIVPTFSLPRGSRMSSKKQMLDFLHLGLMVAQRDGYKLIAIQSPASRARQEAPKNTESWLESVFASAVIELNSGWFLWSSVGGTSNEMDVGRRIVEVYNRTNFRIAGPKVQNVLHIDFGSCLFGDISSNPLVLNDIVTI